ncbi:lysine exporter protein LysE/YggA [Arthrobacter crystallopoietes BAB-32]|uniref:Lysine exporter protein LysE/YggA n=1 Tax=Arthrobacter crystallopoietes BAB-32 TaxID=1246476 RepID=N1V220_9MICC|nr:LysE family translocator [Arthrobacter crystallopoietes]EMY35375.1 lysine exporter protein LysE/YggA [Arthrobacter crystallopoietes BAB-32]
MDQQLFLGFAAVALTLACTPGADWAYSIAAGLNQRSFAPAIAGLCSGYVVLTLLVAAGVAALIASIPALLGWLTIAGAAYLLWLGFTTARSWRGARFSSLEQSGSSRLRSFLRGLGTSSINPKGLLLFLALVPQFISPAAGLPAPVQLGILGLSFVLMVAVVYSIVALAAQKLLQSRPAAARVVTLASGLIMIALGAVLLFEQLAPLAANSALLAA